MTITNLFSLLGGLALFLYGMDLMGKSLERQAGSQLQKILSRLTDNPVKGFLLGLAVTAVIQSSSATTVMVVGFVNSGIMELHQAIGIIMGSNVGTTVTSWILSLTGLEGDSLLVQMLKPSTFSPLLAFIGILMFMFGGERKKGIGGILVGFAILMTGMTAMSDSVAPLENEPWFTELFVRFSNPILGVLVGALVTAVIQSSSASVGILQALSSTGVITFGSAIPIIMGQNIGTCATALISSVGTNKNARRAAIVHLYFNIIGVVVFLVAFYGLNAVFQFSFIGDVIEPWGIAVVHSSFNLGATALLLPFTSLLERLAYLTIPDDEKKERFTLLDERLLNTPSVAADQARSVTSKMAETARRLGLESAVRFLGPRQDVPALLSAMDCFIFPSHHEGLPVTLVEAQAAGLPVAASSAITGEVCITPLVRRLGLDEAADTWAAAALELAEGGFAARSCPAGAIRGAGYDIADTARWLEEFYLARAAGSEE